MFSGSKESIALDFEDLKVDDRVLGPSMEFMQAFMFCKQFAKHGDLSMPASSRIDALQIAQDPLFKAMQKLPEFPKNGHSRRKISEKKLRLGETSKEKRRERSGAELIQNISESIVERCALLMVPMSSSLKGLSKDPRIKFCDMFCLNLCACKSMKEKFEQEIPTSVQIGKDLFTLRSLFSGSFNLLTGQTYTIKTKIICFSDQGFEVIAQNRVARFNYGMVPLRLSEDCGCLGFFSSDSVIGLVSNAPCAAFFAKENDLQPYNNF